MGDITDRGPDSLKIISHLMKLQGQASSAGGRVIVLVGNHEAMNMTGDLRYVSAGEYAAFANADSTQLRERFYAATKAAIAAAYRARSPTMTDDAIHAAWLAQTPLGKLEHQAAWSPERPIGPLDDWQSGDRQGRRHDVRPRRDQRQVIPPRRSR